MEYAARVDSLENAPKEIVPLENRILIIQSENAIVVQRSDGCILNQMLITGDYTKKFHGNIKNLWEEEDDGKFYLRGVIYNGNQYFKVRNRKNKRDNETVKTDQFRNRVCREREDREMQVNCVSSSSDTP